MIKERTKLSINGGSNYFLIASELFRDSTFPFSKADKLVMEIQGNSVLIIKQKEEKA